MLMPEIIQTTVYRLGELSEAARQSARSWYREGISFDDWHEFVFEDFARICDVLGVELKTRPVRLYGGGVRQEPCIWFSGFSSQGDGACFEGWFHHRKQISRRIRDHAPSDTDLHRIADTLQAIQGKNFFQLSASISHRSRYYHECTMAISVERDSPTGQAMTADAEDTVTEALRDLARWLYRELEREYEFQISDEAVDEAIVANEYTFTKAGRRFG
jgi:hypothetical protein